MLMDGRGIFCGSSGLGGGPASVDDIVGGRLVVGGFGLAGELGGGEVPVHGELTLAGWSSILRTMNDDQDEVIGFCGGESGVMPRLWSRIV